MSSGLASGRKWLRWLPGLMISAIAVFAVIRFTHMTDFSTTLRSISLQFILVIVLLALLSLVIRAVAWRTILGNRVDFKTAFFGVSEGYFLNNILPFRAGEIGRSLSVGKASGLGTFHVISTVVIERAFDILFAAAILLFTIPLAVGVDWIKPFAFSALGIVILALLLLFLIASKREMVVAWIDKQKFGEGFIKRKMLPQVEKLLDGMALFTHPYQFLLSLFWIGICWLIWTVLYYYAAAQMVPAAPFWWGAFIGSLLALGVAIPSAPAAVGVFEGSFVGALLVLGVPTGATLAYAIVLHLNQVVITMFFGLWGLIRDGRRISQILELAGAKDQTIDVKA
jgi:uncharacterized protein (TIRG00374 family)